MILHYLGLDHVGHIEGPYAPVNIRRKLHEMDEIVRVIYSSMSERDLMIVLSDHGMANDGGHGGSSHAEVCTPALFLSKVLPLLIIYHRFFYLYIYIFFLKRKENRFMNQRNK